MKAKYQKDLYRYYGKPETFRQRLLRSLEMRYIVLLRKRQASSGLIGKWYGVRPHFLSQKTMIQIPQCTKIGERFYIGHLGRVIINGDSVIGRNVNIATGVTIGQENRDERRGCPTIGDRVWIGTNAVVVGKIHIGDDVLIAPLAFVNFDVLSHSIVVGNPGRIIPSENATEAYIEKTV